MVSIIIACAAACAAAIAAAIAWSTSSKLRALMASHSSLSTKYATLESKWSKSERSHVADALENLAADLSEAKATWAAQRSKLWGKLTSLEMRDDPPDRSLPDGTQFDRDALRREHLAPR